MKNLIIFAHRLLQPAWIPAARRQIQRLHHGGGWRRWGLFLLCAAAAVPSASAQDKATLDLLVKKNLITQAEADGISKTAAAISVTPKDAAVQKLKLEGMIQLQYDWMSTNDTAAGASNPPGTNQFLLKRVYFGALADLGNGFGGEILMDFASGTAASGAPQSVPFRNLFERVIIWKQFDDYGKLTAGYDKPNFVVEENTGANLIKPVDRSLATNYFTGGYGAVTNGRLGFGNRRVGMFWDGQITEVPGFYYGAALTNGIQSTVAYGNPGGFNKFAGWGTVGYKSQAGELKYKIGVNVGYSADGNSDNGATTAAQFSGAIWGYNPYVVLDYGNYELTAEFFQAQVAHGRSTTPGIAPGGVGAGVTSTAAPYGFNVTPSYKINSEWELVGRFSYLSTNGRGVSIAAVESNAPNTVGAGTNFYNNAWAAYGGFNWYIVGNSLKFTAGYEFTQFTNRQIGAGANFTGAHANAQGLRARLQLLF